MAAPSTSSFSSTLRHRFNVAGGVPPVFNDDPEEVKVNNRINEELKNESARQQAAKRREVKVLILGQSDAGKSTLQKQFQLLYDPQSLDVERLSWIPAVYYNVVKAIRMIFADIEYEFSLEGANGRPEGPSTPASGSSATLAANNDASSIRSPPSPSRSETSSTKKAKLATAQIHQELATLRVKLLPLLALENTLAWHLSGGTTITGGRTGAFVRSGWQSHIPALRANGVDANDLREKSSLRNLTMLTAKTLGSVENLIETLWSHKSVKQLVKERKIVLEDNVSYFFNNIDRICEPDYTPTNDDILRARLQTLGVTERSLNVSIRHRTRIWRLYDVAGARGQRHKWASYFDDASAIVFLAPLSAFDQYLEEDPQMNRLLDSLRLFKAICSNELLKQTHLILLLTKIDILRDKLVDGIQVQKYITSFNDRPNTLESVCSYFRDHFMRVHSRGVGAKRPLYAHYTTMLDAKSTHRIISQVGEEIIRKHVSGVSLL